VARAQEALAPVAQLALGEEAGEALARVRAQLDARMAKAGLAV